MLHPVVRDIQRTTRAEILRLQVRVSSVFPSLSLSLPLSLLDRSIAWPLDTCEMLRMQGSVGHNAKETRDIVARLRGETGEPPKNRNPLPHWQSRKSLDKEAHILRKSVYFLYRFLEDFSEIFRHPLKSLDRKTHILKTKNAEQPFQDNVLGH